jgi:hypothetical protein
MTVIAPGIGLASTPNPLVVYEGDAGSLTYKLTNTGDTALTSVGIVDDNGNGGSYTVCSGITLQPGASANCPRAVQFGQTRTLNSTATGDDPLHNPVTAHHTNQVQVISPEIEVLVIKNQTGYRGQPLPSSGCTVENAGTGDLVNVTVKHDNGTPRNSADDVVVSQGLSLAQGQSKPCGSIVPDDEGTLGITVSGKDLLGGAWNDEESINVTLIAPALSLQVSPQQIQIQEGENVHFRYTLKNTGDQRLTGVSVTDDNGTPLNSSDDRLVCAPADMPVGQTRYCDRSMYNIGGTITIIATATGTDSLDNDVTAQTQARVTVGGYIYLPIAIR